MTTRIGVDELRTLFLFESLTDEQLEWLAERAEVRTYDGGAAVYRDGDSADYLFVLLAGRVRLARAVNGEDITINETDHRGVYSGAVRSYVSSEDSGTYQNSLLTLEPSRFFVLPADDFATLMKTWFPMAVHLLDGLYIGIRNSEATVRQREHLARLGTLSANLAHELNNPAAAAVRATGQLRDRVARARSKLAKLADGSISPAFLRRVIELQDRTVARAGRERRQLSPIEVSDAEDELDDRLTELGVDDTGELGTVLVDVGLDAAWVDEVAAELGAGSETGVAEPGVLEATVRWLSNILETESLMNEIEEATGRITSLVGAVKQYSYMDSSSVQEVDVHVGLDSTLVILGHKLSAVEVRREYDRELPKIPVFAAELNQVWTNLIDNAADAMDAKGVLTLRTCRRGEELVVEIADTGPGIPEEVRPRIFQAFFTTKPAGEGSGLGLDNAYRIVVKRHSGAIDVATSPSGTTFTVRLPITQQLG